MTHGGSQYWIDEMKEEGFDMIKVIQGPRTMSNPMKELEADLKEKKVNYYYNRFKRFKNNNIRPVKGKKSKERIDGAVSLIDAYCVLFEKMNDYLALQEE